MALAVKPQEIPLTMDDDGVFRVADTRIPLVTVIGAFERGNTAEDIQSHFPSLRLADIYAVIAYYLNHRAEVAAYLESHEATVAQTWQEIESRSDYQAFRQRLVMRRQANDEFPG